MEEGIVKENTVEDVSKEEGTVEEDTAEDGGKEEGIVEDGPKEEGNVEDGPKEEGNVEDGPKEEGNVEDGPKEEGNVEEEAGSHQVFEEEEGEAENKGLGEEMLDFEEEAEGVEEMLCQPHQFSDILDDEDSDTEQFEIEKSLNLQDQRKMTYVEKGHIRTQQRVLNQMNLLFEEKELNVQKAREEQRECRRRIEALKKEKDDVEEEIQEQEAVKNNAALFRLRAKHRRICEELRGEEDLQSENRLTLVEKERQLLQVELEHAAFARSNQEFAKKVEAFNEQRILEAQDKAECEVTVARNKKNQRNIVKMKMLKDVEERELKHRKVVEEAKKNNQKAMLFLKQSMAKVRKEEAEKELQMRENLQKRIQAVLSLKKSISTNRENIRAVEARNKSMEAEEKAREDRMKEAVILEGGNVIQYLHDLKKMKYIEKKKQEFLDHQQAGRVEIINKILKEESNIEKKKKVIPQPLKSRETGFDEWKSQRKLQKYLEKRDEDEVPIKHEKHWRPASPISETASTPQRTDTFTPESVDLEDEDTIEQPEYLGLWEQDLKSHQVKDDGSSKYPGTSKMERDIIKRQLKRQRRKIIHKQVVAGREFKGSPFYSKPDIIQFKNFDIGETYKMEVIMMNVSYSITFCRLIDVSDHLKDFISVEFKPPGQMSAGMTCKMLVTFKPMVNENLEGEVMFLSQTGPFSVPLKCTIKKCELFVDNKFIDFGTYIIGETVTRTITLTNQGALGTYFHFTNLDLPKANLKITEEISNFASSITRSAQKSTPDSEIPSSKTLYQSSTSDHSPLSTSKPVLNEQKDSTAELSNPHGTVTSALSPTVGVVVEVPGYSPESHDPEEQEAEIRIGQVSEGAIKPFSSIKLQILFLPTIPGEIHSDLEISFSDINSKSIPIKVQAQSVDVPVSVKRPNIDLKICMYDRLYQDSIHAQNRATSALQLTVEVCKELRNHIEILPKMGYIQAHSNFSFQLKFKPRQSLAEDAKNYFDEETRVLEAPMTIWVANQNMSVPFIVHAIVTNSDLEFNQSEIDFGICSIHESVWTTVLLQNKSILPQDFGFIDIPQYIDVQPNDGFGTILPLETINIDIIFIAKQAKEYQFELICKSQINRDFKISCKAIGAYPPLELSHSVINFAATALNDSSTAILYVMNNHTSQNEFTHPVPRIGRGKIAPVGPTSFEFVVPKDSDLTITPSVGTVLPGKKCMVRVLFRPELTPWAIQQEALQLLFKATENKVVLTRPTSIGNHTAEAETQNKKSGSKGFKDTSPTSIKTHIRELKSKTVLFKPPKSESISETSPEYAAGYASSVKNFKSQLNSFTIPCFVTYGQTTEHKDPGYLPYSIHNTLYLQVHCPQVAPPLVLVSGTKLNVVVFGDVAFGQRMVKRVKIQNISKDYLEMKSSTLDPNGPFVLLNAVRPLHPGHTHTLIISFSPTESRVYFEPLEILTEKARLPINLSGTGVKPSIKCSVEGVMNIGYAVPNQSKIATFQLQNDSTLDVDFFVKLDSLSYAKHREQQLLPSFLELKENPSLIGVQNYNGQSVFSVSPINGCLKAKQSQEFQVTFYPDHESLYYSDGLRVELFGTVSRVIQLKGAARDNLVYVEGGEPIGTSTESLTVLLKYDESEEIKPVLLIFRSKPSDNKFSTAVQELRVGCIRSTSPTAKKSVEFYFDSLQGLLAKGFSIDPSRFSVEAGNSRTIIVSWVPPSGYNPSHTTMASVKMTTKGNFTEIYHIIMIAKVVLT